MGFNFRYDSLLSYRQHLKEKAAIELALAQRKLNQDQNRLEDYKNNLTQIKINFDKGLRDKIASEEVRNHYEYITALTIKIEMRKSEIAHSEKLVSEKLSNLLGRTKQYKVIEKLRERDFRKWNQHQLMTERKEMSEIALLRHGKDFL